MESNNRIRGRGRSSSVENRRRKFHHVHNQNRARSKDRERNLHKKKEIRGSRSSSRDRNRRSHRRRRSRSRSRSRDRRKDRFAHESSRGLEESEKLNKSLKDDEEELTEEEKMKRLLGFGDFSTTSGKLVASNIEGPAKGAVAPSGVRKYRQYMNRPGGFNRPLDKMN